MPRSTKTIGLSELRVGLLVLIAIGVLIVLILNASGNLNPFASHLHLRARFTDANGLREGSEVRLAGVCGGGGAGGCSGGGSGGSRVYCTSSHYDYPKRTPIPKQLSLIYHGY